MTEKVDCVVIGSGVIGLAVGRELALAGREVIILESAGTIGSETSSRNSEVIHAGLYYPPGSLKANLCIEGKSLLYAYCAERNVNTRRLGKLLVATNEAQLPKLAAMEANAERNGVADLKWLNVDEVCSIEPEVSCVGALFSPGSGILDSHAYMLALWGDIENSGGMLAFNTPVESGRIESGEIVLCAGGSTAIDFTASLVINCTGLHSPALARSIAGMPAHLIPQSYFSKGNYFAFAGPSPFRHLVYPMPDEASLGIHATLDLGNRVRFGPDVEWIDEIDYGVDVKRACSFATAVRKYWPGLPGGSLIPAYSGIRPKLVGPGEQPADFIIQGPREHGINGLWNLFGMESPGLTASLAIAAEVRRRIGGDPFAKNVSV